MCEDLTTVKAKVPSSKHAQKKKDNNFHTCYNHLSIKYTSMQQVKTHFPFRRKTPRPIVMDNNSELDADFSLNMVAIM
jgi:recombination DNA repair RAD52 pathway protein